MPATTHFDGVGIADLSSSGFLAAALGAGALTIAGKAAAMPSSNLIGVERIVVACEFDDRIAMPLRTSVCNDMVAGLRRRAAYPVVLAGEVKDPDPMSDLRVLLKVSGRSVGGTAPAQLLLTIRSHHPAARGGIAASAESGSTALLKNGEAPGASAVISNLLDKVLPRAAAQRRTAIKLRKAD